MINFTVTDSSAFISVDADITSALAALQANLNGGMDTTSAQALFNSDVLRLGWLELAKASDAARKTTADYTAETTALADKQAAEQAAAPAIDTSAIVSSVSSKL